MSLSTSIARTIALRGRTLASVLAGMGATTVHLALMALKRYFSVLPELDPYADMQRLLSGTLQFPEWLLAYVNGGLILGFIFGKVWRFLPGDTAFTRGLSFGTLAWLALGLGLLPLAGHGPFALALGLGPWPAGLMLVMLSVYAVTMSFLYDKLTRT